MRALAPVPGSTNSANAVLGRTLPRLATPPLRELTPATSYGFDVIDFAEAIGWPLDEWECEAVIRGGELMVDPIDPLGVRQIPRFRFVLVIVARQNGKTLLCRVLTLYWMFIERHALTLGTSTSRDVAKQSWAEVVSMAEAIPELAEELAPVHTVKQIGEETFWNEHGAHYRFAAPNRRAGRGSTVNRLILDELREHRNRDTYDAAVNAGNAVTDFQAWAITNQGDSNSIVLDEIRDAALEFIETGEGDSSTGLLEWSAPRGSDPTSLEMLAMANPNLNRRIPQAALLGQAFTAKRAGGETLARFRTEIMCERVTLLNPAIDPEAWIKCGTGEPVDLAEHRKRVAVCLDVALDGSHATLVAAARIDDLLHAEVIHRWNGFGCTAAVRRELPGILERVSPRVFGWFPAGPASGIAADLRKRRGNHVWPPKNVKVEEINGEIAAVCMGLAEMVASGDLRHPKDRMLDQHVERTQKLTRGDAWTFTRAGDLPVDGTYALAGAVHLARILPAPLKPLI